MFSCQNKQNTTANIDTTSKDNQVGNQNLSLCFQRLEGIQKQDSTFINLIFKGDSVSGILNHLPYEKDSRKGSLQGIRNGDTIKALWSFMQEGMNDTISVEFKLSENELHQKTWGIDKNTGRQKLTDTSTFSLRYQKIDCR